MEKAGAVGAVGTGAADDPLWEASNAPAAPPPIAVAIAIHRLLWDWPELALLTTVPDFVSAMY
jgi:hypothetical protein